MVDKAKKSLKKASKVQKSLPDEEVIEPANVDDGQLPKGFFASEQHFRHVVYRLLSDINEQTASIADALKGIYEKMSDVQSELANIVSELTQYEADLSAAFSSLQAQVSAGETPDLTGLEAIVSKFTSDDAAWKQVAVPTPDNPDTPSGS